MKPKLEITKVEDFEISGDGQAPAWSPVTWQPLQQIGNGKTAYATKAKVVYTDRGIYFLLDCVDQQLTCTLNTDFENIYMEDVVEIFLWPDESQHLYFEYEISPLGAQLPILVPNHQGTFFGWRPWHYEGDRLIKSATKVRGGPKTSMARVEGWSAEFFIPFTLLTGLGNIPPQSGTVWRANMYRIDYDQTPSTKWAWSTDTGTTFHDFRNFGYFQFT